MKKIKAQLNWEDTVKGLMTVPKKDLDKEIAEDQRKKGPSGPQRNTALQHRLAPKLEVIDNIVIRLLAC